MKKSVNEFYASSAKHFQSEAQTAVKAFLARNTA